MILARKRLWLVAGVLSAALLALVLSQADFNLMASLVSRAQTSMLLLAFVLFIAEGVCSAFRLHVMTPGRRTLMKSQLATAWHVLLLVVLPARLGDVAAVGVLSRFLGISTGTAAMSIVVQRMLDVIVLSIAFALFTATLAGPSPSWIFTSIAVAGALTLLLCLHRLDALLGTIARTMLPRTPTRENPRNIASHVLRMILNARVWSRHHMHGATRVRAGLLSVLKWACNLGGITAAIAAIDLPLSVAQSFVVSVAYNYLAAIPLQTVGGIGIGEAGLMGILLLFGLPTELAASAGVLLRILLVAAPVAYWLLVCAGARATRRPG